jgi:hypothetical protein
VQQINSKNKDENLPYIWAEFRHFSKFLNFSPYNTHKKELKTVG